MRKNKLQSKSRRYCVIFLQFNVRAFPPLSARKAPLLPPLRSDCQKQRNANNSTPYSLALIDDVPPPGPSSSLYVFSRVQYPPPPFVHRVLFLTAWKVTFSSFYPSLRRRYLRDTLGASATAFFPSSIPTDANTLLEHTSNLHRARARSRLLRCVYALFLNFLSTILC